jgi:hypothetical protein
MADRPRVYTVRLDRHGPLQISAARLWKRCSIAVGDEGLQRVNSRRVKPRPVLATLPPCYEARNQWLAFASDGWDWSG